MKQEKRISRMDACRMAQEILLRAEEERLKAADDDANREMGLPEDGEWSNK